MLGRSYVRYLAIATTLFMLIFVSALMIPLLRNNNSPVILYAVFCSRDASAIRDWGMKRRLRAHFGKWDDGQKSNVLKLSVLTFMN